MISPLCDLLFWGDFTSSQLFFNYFPNKLNVSANYPTADEHVTFNISGCYLSLTGSLSNGATLELKKDSTLNK